MMVISDNAASKIEKALPMIAIIKLCREYYIRELSLFGSALRDDFHVESDIDLLVDFENDAPISLFELSALQRSFSDLLNRKVDIVVKDGLKPIIRNHVINSARVIYAQ